MSPRSYKSPRREEAKKETLRQITLAVVELHAEKGVLATTHADIAKRANVAIPTVYNYFPSTQSLLPACLSHVQAMAPSLDPHMFSNMQDIPARLALLVNGIFKSHSFYAPWLRWGICEAEYLPELKAFLDHARAFYLDFIEKAFSPGFSGPPPQQLIMIVYALLDFPAWKVFTNTSNLSQDNLEEMITDTLVSLFHHYKNKEIKP
jgi:AcrR family transcriptional regulator